jgi:hypothetical protein
MIGQALCLGILLGIGYLKLPITSYPEYALLDRRTQALLSHPDVPVYEEAFVCFPLFLALYINSISLLLGHPSSTEP